MVNDMFRGMRRRAPLDPYSGAARFPSLAQQQSLQAKDTSDTLSQALAANSLATLKGYGSAAARNNPMQGGTAFAREFPGAVDNQPLQGLLRFNTYVPPSNDAIDQYAAETGYKPGVTPMSLPTTLPQSQPAAPSGFTNAFVASTFGAPGTMPRRNPSLPDDFTTNGFY